MGREFIVKIGIKISSAVSPRQTPREQQHVWVFIAHPYIKISTSRSLLSLLRDCFIGIPHERAFPAIGIHV